MYLKVLKINVQQDNSHYCGFAILPLVRLSPTKAVIAKGHRSETVARSKARRGAERYAALQERSTGQECTLYWGNTGIADV